MVSNIYYLKIPYNHHSLYNMVIKNTLVIGIDLSFNSTGIAIIKFTDKPKFISFHRLVYNKKPTPIHNINQYSYRLPTNIDVDKLLISKNDNNSTIENRLTLKAMICTKRIMDILNKEIDGSDTITDIHINIEGYIMPSVMGIQQFTSLTGLIMLQGMLRAEIIKKQLNDSNHKYSLSIIPPKELKSFFCGNGSADKQIMLDAFIEYYDGKKLLPDTSSLGKINDVIDGFALAMSCVKKLYGNYVYRVPKPKKIKKPKFNPKLKPVNILLSSIPNI